MAQSAGSAECTDCISVEGFELPQRVSRYDTKESGGEAPVMLELWGMQSTTLLPSLSGSLWPGEVATNRVQSMSKIELNCVLILIWIV